MNKHGGYLTRIPTYPTFSACKKFSIGFGALTFIFLALLRSSIWEHPVDGTTLAALSRASKVITQAATIKKPARGRRKRESEREREGERG